MQNEDTLIVGAGPIGLACAVSARRRGIDPLVVDAGAIAQSIVGYPIGMTFFTTPDLLEIGGHPLVCPAQKPTREDALMYYRGVARAEGLRVRTYTRLLGAHRTDDAGSRPVHADLATETGTVQIRCRRLVLATGYFETPRRLDVPGESSPHVSHYFDEAHRHYDRDVVVIGGGNSAVEAALELFRAGARVTIVHRRDDFKRTIKYWVRPDIDNRIAAGEIAARMSSRVVRFEPGAVVVRGASGDETTLRADRAFALIGFLPDQDLFRRIGISLDPVTGVPDLDPETLETNVPGVHMVGSITRGLKLSDVFIENGRFDGEKVFSDVPAPRR